MDDKARALAELRAIFNQWKDLAGRLREPELTAPLPGGLSVKDTLGHLWAWQQVSIARLEAARSGGAPAYPGWAGGDPDVEANTDIYNARIQASAGPLPWGEVYRRWRGGFLRFLALAEAIPEAELLDAARYPWLNGYALIDVLAGSAEHHREHLEDLV